jgi:hypothetical protein
MVSRRSSQFVFVFFRRVPMPAQSSGAAGSGSSHPAIQDKEIDAKLQRSWSRSKFESPEASLPPFDKEWGEVARTPKIVAE